MKRFSHNERRRADLQNVASDILIFADLPRDLVMVFQYLVMIYPIFRLWKTIIKSLGKN